MCGFLGCSGSLEKTKTDAVLRMLKSRGPDNCGVYCSDLFTLCHSRLSIVDESSPAGPYFNEDKSLAIVFNGEIYNYRSLKNTLINKGYSFKTNTDDEVVLYSYQEYGSDCLKTLNGQFAFAIYNLNNHEVFLARDRFGIKPLFYHLDKGLFLFSSKTQTLFSAAGIKKELNPAALKRYLIFRYNDLDETFFKNIFKLPAGRYGLYKDGKLAINSYYSNNSRPDNTISKEDAKAEVRRLLRDSVSLRMPTDIPSAIFLSGGIDSSAIFKEASAISKDINPYSFSLGGDNDEIMEAKETAANFGHSVTSVSGSSDSYLMLDEIVDAFSEPIGDAILLPMASLAREAAKKHKVVLAGEGADELLGGYVHEQLLYKFSRFPKLAKLSPLLADILKIVPLRILNCFFNYPETLKKSDVSKIIKILKNVRDFDALKLAIVSLADIDSAGKDMVSEIAIKDYFNTERISLQGKWLSEYTLPKLDAIGMGFSLESRVPFLDHNLVDFVNTLPDSHLIDLKSSKIILRNAFVDALGPKAAFRPKKAFYFPYIQIFDEDFKTFVESFILSVKQDSVISAYIDFAYLGKMLDNIENLSLTESKIMMNLLILIIWYKKNFMR